MLLGGLWHGAGLTFVAWGLAHAIGLAAGIAWRRTGLRLPTAAGWLATFCFVVLCWVLFRAANYGAAMRIYKALLGDADLGAPATMGLALIAAAAAIALVGPTAWSLAHRLPPRRSVAFGVGLLFASVLLKIGDGANYVFIYFQF
jgi:D-alanyl-lipoteichoic acid acyltransferase DltB (MBOAT superfamily)